MAFGVSLGTAAASIAVSRVSTTDISYSLRVAYLQKIVQGSKIEVLANQAGERTTPTLVAYRDGKKVRLLSGHRKRVSGLCCPAKTIHFC